MPSQLAFSTVPSLAATTGDVRRHREVEAEVHLLVDLLALVEVGAVVGEARLDLRVAELHERPVPQHRVGDVFCGQRGDLGRR